MIYIILAFIGGGLVLLSMVINSQLAKRIGVFQGTLINYVVGFTFSTLALLIFENGFKLSRINFSSIPIWAYFGGVIGVMVVAISNIVIPKIPTIYSTLLIFVGQLFTGIVVDYFSANLISKGKLIGGFLILVGLTYNFNIDRKKYIST